MKNYGDCAGKEGHLSDLAEDPGGEHSARSAQFFRSDHKKA